jgi:hypothetical protein
LTLQFYHTRALLMSKYVLCNNVPEFFFFLFFFYKLWKLLIYLINVIDRVCSPSLRLSNNFNLMLYRFDYNAKWIAHNYLYIRLRTDDTNKLFSKIMKIRTKAFFILIKWILLTAHILIFHSIFHKSDW